MTPQDSGVYLLPNQNAPFSRSYETIFNIFSSSGHTAAYLGGVAGWFNHGAL